MNEEIRSLIASADKAIKEERFDDLMEFYTDDAVESMVNGIFESVSCWARGVENPHEVH